MQKAVIAAGLLLALCGCSARERPVAKAGRAQASTLANDGPYKWFCAARVDGPQGQDADATFFIKPDGTIGGWKAEWTPPSPSQPADESLPHVELQFTYDKADRSGPGIPTLALIDSYARPDMPEFGAKQVEFAADRGKTWKMQFGDPSTDGGFQEQVVRFATNDGQDTPTKVDLLNAIGSTRGANINLLDQRGHLISRVRFDLSAKRRNCLMGTVWAAVAAAAKNPDSAGQVCGLMGGQAPSIYNALKHTNC